MSKYKVGDEIVWTNGKFSRYRITKVNECDYHVYSYQTELTYRDQRMDHVDEHSRKLTKLELALK